MFSVSHNDTNPQEKAVNLDENPAWVDGRLLFKRFVARDPLTCRAYFDAIDITPQYEAQEFFRVRRQALIDADRFELRINRDMIKIKGVTMLWSDDVMNGGGGRRGRISGFSRASRKRMMEFIASARYDTEALFLTLTYPDRFPEDINQWKAHFEAFRRRFERAYPEWRCLWRIELKARKSGENEGKIAPHYHFVVWTDINSENAPNIDIITGKKPNGKSYKKAVSSLSMLLEEWALQNWNNIVFSSDGGIFASEEQRNEDQEKHLKHGAFAVHLRNHRHAMSYVSKYVAKPDEEDFQVGRRWGRIGQFDTRPSGSALITKPEYVQLARLIRSWLRSRERRNPNRKKNPYSRFFAKQSCNVGRTVFGIGDHANRYEDASHTGSFISKLLDHASALAGEMPPYIRDPIQARQNMIQGLVTHPLSVIHMAHNRA